MNEIAAVSTRDALRRFGFVADTSVVSDERPGLAFNFGSFKLSASWVTNMQFAECVLFTGVLSTTNEISHIEFQIPREVASREQCAAWIVWHLDRTRHDGTTQFTPARGGSWLSEGRRHLNQLPWFVEREEYEPPQNCFVDRQWLRVALKKLKDKLAAEEDSTEVIFGFVDGVLTIRCGDSVIAFPAEGQPWPDRYVIPAGRMRSLPKRLMSEMIRIDVWKDNLRIAGYRFEGVEKVVEDSE